MHVRKPAVAGSFYPSDSSELGEYLKKGCFQGPVRPVKALITPHAGYIYSGRTALKVFSQIEVPERNLLIGPNHRGMGSDFALYPDGVWKTPLGEVSVDQDLAAKLLESSHDLHADPEAHGFEHSLEVILPFLQIKNPQARIVPLIAGTLDWERARTAALAMGERLASFADPVLVVVSNDMSHYENEASTREKDRYALDAILNLDPAGLVEAVTRHRITMCGFIPVYMLLIMAATLGITKASLVEYTTSAEASGDYDRVVGYAGFIFE